MPIPRRPRSVASSSGPAGLFLGKPLVGVLGESGGGIELTVSTRRGPGRLGIWRDSINWRRILATSSRLTASSSAMRRSDQSWCSFSLTSTARRRSARVSGRP